MLGKLIKYEWQGMKKPLLILFLVLLGITLLTAILILTINPSHDDIATGFSIMFTLLSVFLYYFGIIACSFGTMLLIAIRFYKTCYTDEAYLTHTLPVSTKQLVAAKTITAVLCQLLSVLLIVVTMVLLISVFITHMINLGEFQASDFSLDWSTLNAEFKEEMGVSFTGYFGFMGIYSLIGSVTGTIMILGCISLGQLYAKHRILGAIIAYFGVTTILQIVAYLGMIPMYGQIFKAELSGETLNMVTVMGPTFLIILVASITLAVILHFVNIHMMSKRLNLE